MLDWLRRDATEWQAGLTACILASAGPAGVQASQVDCLSQGLRLYLLLSTESDHLLNIETTGEVARASDGWRLTGEGRCLGDDPGPWVLTRQPWQIVVEVIQHRFQVAQAGGHVGV